MIDQDSWHSNRDVVTNKIWPAAVRNEVASSSWAGCIPQPKTSVLKSEYGIVPGLTAAADGCGGSIKELTLVSALENASGIRRPRRILRLPTPIIDFFRAPMYFSVLCLLSINKISSTVVKRFFKYLFIDSR
jgi:hypothetical protein